MAFTPKTWEDGSAGGTPITAAELNRMESGIAEGQNVASPTWATLTGKPATFPPALGTTESTALASNTPLLALGSTASTAKAGNWNPTIANVTGLEARLVAIEARITALESPAG